MTHRVQIDSRWVGYGEPVFVIAEIGSNHDQDFDRARRLIDASVDAGADAVKFQLFSARALYPHGGDQSEILRKLELPYDWVPALADHARDRGVPFLASPFDEEAVRVLVSVGTPAIKIASSETVNLPLVAHAAATQRPMIVSTGMCDLADVSEAVETIRSAGNRDIVLLKCSALYPTEPAQAHLAGMKTLRRAFAVPVGFSDHTLGIAVAIAAVAQGAAIIEKHFTLDRAGAGPDHFYAQTPPSFASMVQAIREAEASIGDPTIHMLPAERVHARRDSLRATTDLTVGTALTRDHLTEERPADGIRPRFARLVVGRRLRRAVARGEAITWESLEP